VGDREEAMKPGSEEWFREFARTVKSAEKDYIALQHKSALRRERITE